MELQYEEQRIQHKKQIMEVVNQRSKPTKPIPEPDDKYKNE